MNEEPMEYTKMEETIEEFEKLSCTMVPEVENHTKTRPNCRNETKWNCISDWVLNDRGEKVSKYVCRVSIIEYINLIICFYFYYLRKQVMNLIYLNPGILSHPVSCEHPSASQGPTGRD